MNHFRIAGGSGVPRLPDNRNLTVDAERGRIEVQVGSAAFRPTTELRVTSSDEGLTWPVEP
jgi:hypothetical protein